MKWFSNLKTSKKLISSFMLVALIWGAMGAYAIYDLNLIHKYDTQLYENVTVPISEMGEISTEFQRLRADARDMIIAQSSEDIEAKIKSIEARRVNIDKMSDSFEKRIISDEIKAQFDIFIVAKNDFKPQLDKVLVLAKDNKDVEIMALINVNGEVGKASIAEQNAIEKLVSMEINAGKVASDFNAKTAKTAITLLTGIIIIVIIISLVIGIYISRLITNPIKRVLFMIEEMDKGHLTERLNINTNDEIGEMARTMDSFADRLQNVIVGTMNKISKGDVSMEIDIKDEKDELSPALKKMVENINALVTDINILSKAATNGKLDKRADATKHSGDFRTIIEGVNELIQAMVNPIEEVTSVMSEIAKGNLEVSVRDDYKGEFGVLANAVNITEERLKSIVGEISGIIGEISQGNLVIENIKEYDGNFKSISVSLNTIIDSLNTVLSEINVVSEQVFVGASQVADASQALSQGTTEQASAIEELTSSITEVAAQTKENAFNANQAKNLTIKVKENAEEGSIHMSEMLKSMGEINESSANISKIIKVIDDIAFQTNILALNAAVEAARAGQHGKGFAVVAEEVRNLAARSANAAKETTDLIEGSIKKAEKGTDIANNTAKALYEIVDGVTKATILVAEIAASSNEQATGISQINLGLEQVSQVVQTNSATSEESAAASEELSSQAELLKEMVGDFKLKNNNGFGISSSNNVSKNKKYYSEDHNMNFKGVAATSSKSKIALSDKEFGKY